MKPMADLWINPKPRPHRPRLEQDLELLRLSHLPKTANHLASMVAKDVRLPHRWGWDEVKAYQRVHSLLMGRAKPSA